MLTRPHNLGEAWKSIFADTSPGATKRMSNALDFVIKEILDRLGPGDVIGTTELGEMIWPRASAKSMDALKLRRKMFNTLLSNESIAAGYRRRMTSAAVNRYGVATHPWEWFNGRTTSEPVRKSQGVGLETPQLPAEQGVDLLLKNYGFDEKSRDAVKNKIMRTD